MQKSLFQDGSYRRILMFVPQTRNIVRTGSPESIESKEAGNRISHQPYQTAQQAICLLRRLKKTGTLPEELVQQKIVSR